MISRIYTIEHHQQDEEGKCHELVDQEMTFKGFDRRFSPPPPFMALLSVQGELDQYALDDDGPALEELKRMLFDHEPVDRLMVFKLVHEEGPNY